MPFHFKSRLPDRARGAFATPQKDCSRSCGAGGTTDGGEDSLFVAPNLLEPQQHPRRGDRLQRPAAQRGEGAGSASEHLHYSLQSPPQLTSLSSASQLYSANPAPNARHPKRPSGRRQKKINAESCSQKAASQLSGIMILILRRNITHEPPVPRARDGPRTETPLFPPDDRCAC
ncbi:uncharacterized protein K452DRAFT_162918 [Aplosporella prunicola CBS 121167]|uniref:Uncharacterized protein n=1 Tax=Aplosporella prunicola CBS 121167 TaxID=1176127 RepID=A0A6A6BMM0_9PEZI|nr:uncharacterized protein K452DRAFT_162918 [Aplosporella prunicola CBS 121167]KAF2143811.1 hypothetical protein K452DRAFT_162918 [Aplosporella prunicola CBS 121167]